MRLSVAGTEALLTWTWNVRNQRVSATERFTKAAGWVGTVMTPTVMEMVVVQGSEIGADDLALLALRADVVHCPSP